MTTSGADVLDHRVRLRCRAGGVSRRHSVVMSFCSRGPFRCTGRRRWTLNYCGRAWCDSCVDISRETVCNRRNCYITPASEAWRQVDEPSRARYPST